MNRMHMHPAAVVLGIAFVIVAWNASWLEAHAAAVREAARDAGAVLCVLAAWALAAGVIRAVTRQRWVTRTYGHLDLDLSPLPEPVTVTDRKADPQLAPLAEMPPVPLPARDELKAEVTR